MITLLKEYVRELVKQSKTAACVLIMSADGMILTVSRKKDPTMLGLPGGKVDHGESFQSAASRELFEETGLLVNDLKFAFSKIDKFGFKTITFLCDAEGEIKTHESGIIRWVKPEVLVDPKHSPYVDYNKDLFDFLKISYS